jgi:hypothetical protein
MSITSCLKNWFQTRKTPLKHASIRPMLEALEGRWCPASVNPDVYEQLNMGTSSSNAINLGPAAPGAPLHFSQSGLSMNSANTQEWFKFSLTGQASAADQATDLFMNASLTNSVTMTLRNSALATIGADSHGTLSLSGHSAGTYYLQVFMHDTSQGFGYYTLNVDISPTDPTTPYNLTPVNNATVTTLTPTFTWAPATGAAASTHLYLQDMTMNNGGITESDKPASLLSGHVYQWYVQSYSNTPQSSPFTLTVLVPDANEPNDTTATATSIGTATPTAPLTYSTISSIYQAGDVDFYSFTVTATTGLGDHATLTFAAPAVSIDLSQEIYMGGGRQTHAFQSPDGYSYYTGVSGPVTIPLDNLPPAGSGTADGTPTGTYFLRVRSVTPNRYALNVSLSPVTDPFPTLNAPGQVASLRPSLSWQNAAGAIGYQVWIDDLTAGTSNLFPAIVATTSWTPPADLVSGDTYRWWVRGFDHANNAFVVTANNPLPWSHPQDFTVSTVAFAPISGPIPSEFPTITWTGLQGTSASSYSVWVSNLTTGAGNLFPAPVVVANGTTYQWQADAYLTPGNKYSIYVKANNANKQGAWTGETFTIGTIAYAQPKTALASLRPSIAFTPIAGAFGATYELDDLTSHQSNLFPGQALTGNTWSPPSNLILGHSYRLWGKVSGPTQASFNSGQGWWGAGVDFTINTSIAGLPGPAQTLRPTLWWDPLAGVANYEVYVTDNAGGASLTPGLIVNTNSWTPDSDLISGHSYTMWVRAQNGPWSAPQSFQIALVSGFGGVNYLAIAFVFPIVTWTPLTGVKDYVVWLDDLTTGASNLYPNQVVSTQTHSTRDVSNLTGWFMPSGINANHTYRLYVKARNQNDQGEWSLADIFTPAQFQEVS